MDYPRSETHKLYRERDGYVLGVIEGLANWTGLPVLALRIIAVILLFKVGFVPIGIAYLGSALLMPAR
ncbi:MAG: PspC domain-containing protein [Sphaerochaeta sp.]|nr:PspC domain-containing protein [Sphaerochaeta sp.]